MSLDTLHTNNEENNLIVRIARRAGREVFPKHGISQTPLITVLDVSFTHGKVCPLDLCRFLEAGEANFAHDILGITRYLDREAGKFENGFTPRYALQALQSANAQGSDTANFPLNPAA
jgi:hypothetical protein